MANEALSAPVPAGEPPALEYLFEVRALEMPERFVHQAVRQLAFELFEELTGRGLGPREVVTGVSSRRLLLCLKGLPAREPDRREQELGPPVAEAYGEDGAPTEALRGFAERLGVEGSALATVKTERGEYLAATREVAGRPTREVLAEVVPRALAGLVWSDRSGLGDPGWVRPVASVVSLLDGEVVPFALAGVVAGRETAGHPLLSPEPFAVDDFAGYQRALHARGIEPSLDVRRATLARMLVERAAEAEGEVVADSELLERLAAGTEVLGVVAGSFPPDFLELSEEVVLAALMDQHGAFALRRRGELMPTFLAVTDRADDPAGVVRAGHQRAVAGRLSDVRFACRNDRRLPLAERARRLDQLAFHPQLGSYARKTERLRALVELAVQELGWEQEKEGALQAVALLKADLTTEVVRRIPALRGTIGGIYAREEGYVESVWQAIYDHYRPASLDGPIPRHRIGQLVAVADRLDTLIGLLSVAPAAPSASKDPFALRRLAQGLLRTLIEAEIALDLDLIAARAVLLYGDLLAAGAEEVLQRLQTLLADRTAYLLGQRGFAHDEVEAAMAIGKKKLPDLVARVTALHQVREEAGFRSLVRAAKRISNIVKDVPEFELNPELLDEAAELELHRALAEVREKVDGAAAERRYDDCLRHMSELVPPLDRFFADVLVMDEDEARRQNRLALLQACRRIFWRIARLKALAVEKGENG